MDWHVLAFIAPAIWAACNYIDKFIIDRYFKQGSTATLVMISGFTASIAAFFIWLSGVNVLAASNLARFVLVGNGALFIIAFVPYFYALRQTDASVAIPVFQTIPVFSYFLGLIFLGETLTLWQIIAGLMVIGGAVGLSLELKGGIRLNYKPLLLMLCSSFLIAVGNLIFKKVALQESFWISSFWQYLGTLTVTAFLFIFFTKQRQDFLTLFSRKKALILGLSSLQEALNTGANLMFDFALLLAPLAIVNVVVNGLQPLYILIFGVILTALFPAAFSEKISPKDILQKIFFIAVIFIGTLLLRQV